MYDALQLYVGHVDHGVTPPPPTEEDEMLDFEDIQGVYDSVGAASQNTQRLNDFLSQEAAPTIRFAGKPNSLYNNKRTPSRAYFDDTIVIPADKPVFIDGGNGRLSWITITDAKPGMSVGSAAGSLRRLIQNFDADSTGSGLLFQTPGKGTCLRNVRFSNPDDLWNNACTGTSGAVSLDDMTDLALASYALKIEDSDGITVEDFAAIGPGDHGILIQGRLHDAFMRARIWGCKNGQGFKGVNINGGQFDVICESCYGEGYYLEDCGLSVIDGAATTHLTHDKPQVFDFWVEANNGRGNTISGLSVRQGRITRCGAQVVTGSNAWGDNKINMDEGSRNSGMMLNSIHVSHSVSPMYDLENEDDLAPTFILPDAGPNGSVHNFETAWPSGGEPSVTVTGTQGTVGFLITFPANCFSALTGELTAYWRPWGALTNFTVVADDMYEWQMELTGDLNLYQWCNAHDNVNSTIVVPTMAPYSGPAAAVWAGLYNGQARKFSGRVAIKSVGASRPTPALTWSPGLPDNASPMTLTVSMWKMYGIRAAGGAVPQT